MSATVWKVVRVDGKQRLSAFCRGAVPYPGQDYTGGVPVAQSVAYQAPGDAREFAHGYCGGTNFEVWECTCDSYDLVVPEDLLPNGNAKSSRQAGIVSARNLRLVKRIARYENGKEVDCPEMSYEEERKPEFCENCGCFLDAESGGGSFKPNGNGLCFHCAIIYEGNIVRRPRSREDFKAKFVTRKEHDAAISTVEQWRAHWEKVAGIANRQTSNLLGADANLQAEVERLHSVEQEALEGTYGDVAFGAGVLRRAATLLTGLAKESKADYLRRIADALDPPAEEQAAAPEAPKIYTEWVLPCVLKCPDCGEKSDSAVLAQGHPLCNACIAKGKAEDAKRRLRERGERVKAALSVGATVKVVAHPVHIRLGLPTEDEEVAGLVGTVEDSEHVDLRANVCVKVDFGAGRHREVWACNLIPLVPAPGFAEEDE